MSDARRLRDALRRVLAAHHTSDGERRPCGTPLPLPHAHALLCLREADVPLRVSALAAQLSIDRTNVSRLCARMEALGEVERRLAIDDRRARVVALTSHGRALADHVDASSARHFAQVAAALGPDTAGVVDALAALADALAASPPEHP
jgi:DNA-binding MarR family transcriptional regulator